MTVAARKLTPLPEQAPPKRSKTFELMMLEMETADVEGFALAAKRYGDDTERELADLQAHRHPLQRRKPSR